MRFIILCVAVLVFEARCAPVEGDETTEEEKVEDTPQAPTEKNPIQQWFENLSKNASTNTQNTMNAIKDWFSKLSPNSGSNGSGQNLPTMYMGSFQLLKMPVPQFSDIVNGMGNLATAAQAVNKLTGGLPLPGLQG